MFIFAWGVSYNYINPQSISIIIIFLTILFVPLGYTLYLSGRRKLW